MGAVSCTMPSGSSPKFSLFRVGESSIFICYYYFPRNIIYFLVIAMNNSEILNSYEDEGLFLYSPSTGTEESI